MLPAEFQARPQSRRQAGIGHQGAGAGHIIGHAKVAKSAGIGIE
jgi:hypothetical protein